MKIVSTVEDLQAMLDKHRSKGKTIGFAPTMGALHDGHMSLMRHSVDENDITICSIFVNPTQFNEKSDLEKYPRTIEADARLLKKNKVNILFSPAVSDVYPKKLKTKLDIDFKGLDEEMEGEFRPGHFDGVAQVVKRLLDIVNPDRLYMGQKDFQQFTLIQYMIEYYDIPTALRVVPIKRESSGLAMSSRNVRLSKEERTLSAELYKTLKAVNRKKYQLPISELQKYAMKRLAKHPGFRPEYFTIANARSLKKIRSINAHDYIVACTAVWVGEVRLIDNMVLKKPRSLKIFVKD